MGAASPTAERTPQGPTQDEQILLMAAFGPPTPYDRLPSDIQQWLQDEREKRKAN